MAIVISNNDLPKSGQPFSFTVEGYGLLNTTLYIKEKLIYQRECPDPPCHEICRIPSGTEGFPLIMEITSETGETLRKHFKIDDGLLETAGGPSLTRSH